MDFRVAGSLVSLVFLATSFSGCGGSPGASGPLDVAGTFVKPARTWNLKGDGLSEGDRLLRVSVKAPAGSRQVTVSMGSASARLSAGALGLFEGELEVGSLPTGDYVLEARSDDNGVAFAKAPVKVSYPLYVLVTTDWDDSRLWSTETEPANAAYDPRTSSTNIFFKHMEEFHVRHAGLQVTHFFGAYHFTDPDLLKDRGFASGNLVERRRQDVTDWIKGQRDTHGDEIGVHLHGWCHFVESVGVRCLTSPEETFIGTPYGPRAAELNASGVAGILAEYDLEETRTLLNESVRLFELHGLGRPTSFRAGGWSADAETFQALQDTGFRVDTSAMVPSHIRSQWEGTPLFDFVRRFWSRINETSQPYFPSKRDAQLPGSGGDALALLEVPDNGNLVDYMTAVQMAKAFCRNLGTSAIVENTESETLRGCAAPQTLSTPGTFVVGYHPPSLDTRFFGELDSALSAFDGYLASKGTGPVRYVRMSDLTKVWKSTH